MGPRLRHRGAHHQEGSARHVLHGTEFWKAFAVHEITILKKNFVEVVAMQAAKDLGKCEAAVNTLEWKTKQLTNMHNARVCTRK